MLLKRCFYKHVIEPNDTIALACKLITAVYDVFIYKLLPQAYL